MSYSQLFSEILLSWPLLFFGTIMLTEPYTMPHKRNLQILFGMLVGILFGARFHIGPFFSTPETALIIGNIFAYLVSPKMKLFLTLQKKVKLSSTMYHFYFSKPPHFNFEAGQYMEWTLPLETSIQSDKNQFPDSRGNRRFFTIASAPSEATLQLGVKILETKDNPSFFKQALAALKPGDSIVASQLGGDFTVPKNISHYSHIVFIAGGIGITPFRSMIEELGTANKISANSSIPNITLFYCSSYQDEFIYQDTFENKKSSSFLKPVYVLTRPENVTKDWELKQAQSNICKSGPAYEAGRLNQAKLKKYVPQPEACLYYLSGPNVMVEAYKSVLLQMNVPHTAIKTDYFPGF